MSFKYLNSAALFFMLLFIVGWFLEVIFMLPLIIILTVVYILIFFSGIFVIRLNFFVKSINIVEGNKILLTFDDGPDEVNTPKVLDVLKENNIKALFFLIGNKVDKEGELVKRIVNEGHAIGNHTFSHTPKFTSGSQAYIETELNRCSKAITDLGLEKPKFFRPPFGITNPRMAKAIENLNLQSVGWNIRSLDTQFKSKKNLLSRIEKIIKPGGILLLHDRCRVTADALPEIIELCKKRGFEFTSPSQLKMPTS